MTTQPFFAVRVVLTMQDGTSAQRDYVRGQQHIGRDAFASFALGDLLTLTHYGDDSRALAVPLTWDVFEIAPNDVYDNRLHHHTTH